MTRPSILVRNHPVVWDNNYSSIETGPTLNKPTSRGLEYMIVGLHRAIFGMGRGRYVVAISRGWLTSSRLCWYVRKATSPTIFPDDMLARCPEKKWVTRRPLLDHETVSTQKSFYSGNLIYLNLSCWKNRALSMNVGHIIEWCSPMLILLATLTWIILD